LGFGVLTTVAPANAAVATGLNVAVGPNGATSLTVVGATPAALVRLDVTSNDTLTGQGLSANETVTVSVTGVPTASGKTLAANGGSTADTSAGAGSGKSDFVILETAPYGMAQGVTSTTADLTTSKATNWTKFVASISGLTNLDSASANASKYADGQIGSNNTGHVNMDTVHEKTNNNPTRSYYVTILPRTSAVVLDQGAYTFSFQLTDAAGVVRSTKTITVDFVSTAAKSDAKLAINTAGVFKTATALATTDIAATTAAAGYVAYANVALTNRDGGQVRNSDGSNPAPSFAIQNLALTTSEPKSTPATPLSRTEVFCAVIVSLSAVVNARF